MRHNCGRLSVGTRNVLTRADIPPSRLRWVPAAAAVFILAASQGGCFFRKNKVAEPQARPPARIVLLPMNVPAENADLRWLALAAPVLMAQAIENSPDLEVVPLWETMPVVKETLGESRTITTENAEYLASRMTAKWAAQGEITADKEGISMLLDFIPAKATLVPFRYEKKGPVAGLGDYVAEAFEQFLRYLVARPQPEKKRLDPNSIRAVAEAIDREYGWFVDAEPGKAQSIVAGFAQTDSQIAGLLFNPNLYPGVKPAGTAPAPATRQPEPAPVPAPVTTPPVGSPPERVSAAVPAGEAPQPAAVESITPAAPDAEEEIEVPPPRSFIQRINSPPALPDPAPVPARRPPPKARATAIKAASPPPNPAATKAPALPGPADCRIQVFASHSRSQAELFSARLSGAGLQPQMEKADLKEKGIWYRVRLKGYPSRQAAIAAADKLRADELIKDYWILR